MKVFVAGASGRVGRKLTEDLVADGHDVIAASRHPESIEQTAHVHPVHMDLHGSVENLSRVLDDADAVYFVAGSRGADLLQTDAFGAVKLMEAAKRDGISRFVILSSIFALEPEKWAVTKGIDTIIDYDIAKFFADNYLVHQSGLDYTVVQPGTVTEDPGTGKITIDAGQAGTNPIDDVALTLAKVLEHSNTIGKVLKMRTGDTPIDRALADVK
jgi:nucleoside-diphosphate-sugar epimerase